MEYLLISKEQILLFLLVFTRTTAMISLLPIYGSNNIPALLKAGLSFLLALIVFPLLAGHSSIVIPGTTTGFVLALVREIGVGILIGFVGTFLFAAVQFAGYLVDIQIGFGFVRTMDPFSQNSATVMGQLKMLVFTIIFLLINGHYFMLLAVQKSFDLIPLMGARMPGGKFAFLFTDAVSNILITGFKLAAPVYVTMILTSISLGLVARTVPQMNVFFVGLPLKIGLGLLTTIIVLPALVVVFKGMVENVVHTMWRLLFLMA